MIAEEIDKEVDEVAIPSYLDMSDEEMQKVNISTIGVQPTAGEDTDSEIDPEANSETTDEDKDSVDTKTEDSDLVADAVVKDDVQDIEKADADTKPDDDTPAAEIDYKAAYERLVAPFKANGKDIVVNGVDDAIALMQMGANYTKKMAALKPSLKIMKLLENNGLLNESKLAYLIDLDKKNPDAIAKLVKESGIDPLDLGGDDQKEYVPNRYSVGDLEMELDQVLEELQETPTYSRTLDIVSNKWDGSSKQVIANSPQILRVINDHMQSGIYDLIHTEIESERVYGRLNGLSDIEAYRQIGDAIQARGGFDHLGHQRQQAQRPAVVQPKPKVEDDKLKDKRRAAGTTKPAGATTEKADFNPLALSDEEFSKQANGRYL